MSERLNINQEAKMPEESPKELLVDTTDLIADPKSIEIIKGIEEQIGASRASLYSVIDKMNAYRKNGDIHTNTVALYEDPLRTEMSERAIKRRYNENKKNGTALEQEISKIDAETLSVELANWLTQEKVDYMKKAIESDSDLRFTLVMAPNVPVTDAELVALAIDHGESNKKAKDAKVEIFFNVDDFCKNYSPEQLAGYNPDGGAVNFCLIPNHFTPGFKGRVDEQRAKLSAAQVDNPFLRVPSVFEDICYWNTIRERVGGIDDSDTCIRHFDLSTTLEKGFLSNRGFVPDTCLNGGIGIPVMTESSYKYAADARIAIG